MRWIACLVTLAAGCGFAPSAGGDAHGSGSGSAIDAAIDGMVDTPPGVPCFGGGAIDLVCSNNFVSTSKTYTNNTQIDTDDAGTCVFTKANNIDVCVVSFGSITIADNVTVSAQGSRPLVLVATLPAGTIVLAGPHAVLNVGSHRGGATGAGTFDGAACTTGATAATSHGGGYGGTFTLKGGNGGNNNGNTGGGAASNAQATPTTLHGGCPGSTGEGNVGIAPGGGVVALIAPTIVIGGFITVSGAGGNGTTNGVGGNGGGAGGMIVLDAVQINGAGTILSQGGGGGEGSAGNAGDPGFDGFIDTANRSSETLGGSTGSPSGGDGGNGGSTAAASTGDHGFFAGANAGGGGGGGAVGITFALRGVPALGLSFTPPVHP